MTVAAFLLLATGLSLTSLVGGDSAREAAGSLAAHLARQLDALAVMDGEMIVTGGVGVSGPFQLPPMLAGSAFHVEFRSTDVRVVAQSVVSVADLHWRVHPFAPQRAEYTGESLARSDTRVVSIATGQRFVVERTVRTVDGVPAYMTFVYLPP